jgi:hypothetical protein
MNIYRSVNNVMFKYNHDYLKRSILVRGPTGTVELWKRNKQKMILEETWDDLKYTVLTV